MALPLIDAVCGGRVVALRYALMCALAATFVFAPAGYQAILPVLLAQGAYGSRCAAAGVPAPCDEQRLVLDLMFSLSVSLLNSFAVVAGLLVRRFGARAMGTCAALGISACGVLMALSSSPAFEGYFPAYVLMGTLSCQFGFAMFEFVREASGVLGHAGTLFAIVMGAVDLSSLQMLVVQRLFESGVPYTMSLLPYIVVAGVTGVLAPCMFAPSARPAAAPAHAVVPGAPASGEQTALLAAAKGGDTLQAEDDVVLVTPARDGSSPAPPDDAPGDPALCGMYADAHTPWCPCSCGRRHASDTKAPRSAHAPILSGWPFVAAAMWMSAFMTTKYFFMTNMNVLFVWASGGDSAFVDQAELVFNIALPASGVFVVVIVAFERYRVPPSVMVALMGASCVLTGVCASLQVPELQYATSVSVVFARFMLFACGPSIFIGFFGGGRFTVVYGVAVSIAAVVNLSTYLWSYLAVSVLSYNMRPLAIALNAWCIVASVLLLLTLRRGTLRRSV